MTIYERKSSNELTSEQRRNARRLLLSMDQGLHLPPIERRPDTGPLVPTIDQLCEAYREAGTYGFKKALDALKVDQPILSELVKVSRYKPVSISEMLEMADQEWIITNILYEDAITAVYGPPGCGKSFLALDWACHLALGLDWLGRKVKRCRVIYVATEGPRGYKRRIRAWCHKHNIAPEKLLNVITFVPVDVPLGNSAEVDEFIDEQSTFLQGHNDGLPTVIILDTLFQCAAGLNINQTDVMTTIVKMVRHIKTELGADHILLIHHRGKDKDRGMSGNMALKAGVDLEYEAEADNDGNITLKADKVKDDEETITYLRRVRVVYGDGPRDHSCVIESGEKPAKAEQLPLTQQRMLEVLPIDENQALSFTQWLKAVNLSESTFKRHLENLKAKGLIRNIGSDTKPLYVQVALPGMEKQEMDGDDE